jgi:hypothetical protein
MRDGAGKDPKLGTSSESSHTVLEGLSALKKVSYNIGPTSWYERKNSANRSRSVSRKLLVSEEKVAAEGEGSAAEEVNVVGTEPNPKTPLDIQRTSPEQRSRNNVQSSNIRPLLPLGQKSHRFKFEVGIVRRGGDYYDKRDLGGVGRLASTPPAAAKHILANNVTAENDIFATNKQKHSKTVAPEKIVFISDSPISPVEKSVSSQTGGGAEFSPMVANAIDVFVDESLEHVILDASSESDSASNVKPDCLSTKELKKSKIETYNTTAPTESEKSVITAFSDGNNFNSSPGKSCVSEEKEDYEGSPTSPVAQRVIETQRQTIKHLRGVVASLERDLFGSKLRHRQTKLEQEKATDYVALLKRGTIFLKHGR